jgi:hypothetical protein
MIDHIDSGSRALSFLIGAVVIGVAATSMMTSFDPSGAATWAYDLFGAVFLALYAALVFLAIFCWVRIQLAATAAVRAVWLDAGFHAANGVVTLALTFTLLGVSLGIGSLTGRDLAPDTIQPIIQEMTKHFSVAFMTTVIGLPTAAVLRAMLGITGARLVETEIRQKLINYGEGK